MECEPPIGGESFHSGDCTTYLFDTVYGIRAEMQFAL